MSDKGIIFSAPMVRALIEGRKTQTRRLLSLRGFRGFTDFGPSSTAGFDWHFRRADRCWCDITDERLRELLPYAPGDRLYVRESALYWIRSSDNQRHKVAAFKADGYESESGERWTPSIHMPRKFSRLWLAVTDVRAERLQDISGEDAEAEGVFRHVAPQSIDKVFRNQRGTEAIRYFFELWASLHDKPGERWEDNPWLVAVTFDVHHGNIDQVPA